MYRVTLTLILVSSFVTACKAPPAQAPVQVKKVSKTSQTTQKVLQKAPPKPVYPKLEALKPFDAAFKRRQASWRQWHECFGKDRLVVCLMGTQGGGDGQIVLGRDVPQHVVMSHSGGLTKDFDYLETLFRIKRKGNTLILRGPVLPMTLTPRTLKDTSWVDRLTKRPVRWQISHFGKAIVLTDTLNASHMDAVLVLGEQGYPMRFIEIENGTVVHNKQVTVDGVHYHFIWPNKLKIDGKVHKSIEHLAEKAAPRFGAEVGRTELTDQWAASDLVKQMFPID